VGGIGAASIAGNVALAIKFGTGLSGRSHRGRVYLAGLPENAVTGNEITPTYRTTLVTAVANFAGGVTGIMDAAHVIVSTCQDGAWLTNAEVTPVNSYSADVYVDSQRRRLTGRGI